MTHPVLLIVCACLLSAGCSKHESAAPASGEAPPTTADVNTAVPPSPASVVVADTGDESATLAQLSAELRRYVVRSRSAPTSFEEFVTQAHVQAPPAPAGKKYVISKGTVLLVKK